MKAILGGEGFASAGADGEVLFWDMPRDRRLHRPDGGLSMFQADQQLDTIAYSRDGRHVACGGEKTLVVVDAESKKLCQLAAPEQRIVAIEFLPASEQLIALDSKGTLTTWDWHTGAQTARLELQVDELRCSALSPRGDELAITVMSSNSHSVRILSWPDGRELKLFPVSANVELVRFTPDGSQLAIGRYGEVTFYDAHSFEPVQRFGDDGDEFFDLDFLPDGHRMIVAEGRHGVTLREVSSGEVLSRLSGHMERVMAVAASSNGRNLASWCEGGLICVWDLATEQTLLKFQAPIPRFRPTLRFSPRGDRLAVAQVGDEPELIVFDATSRPATTRGPTTDVAP